MKTIFYKSEDYSTPMTKTETYAENLQEMAEHIAEELGEVLALEGGDEFVFEIFDENKISLGEFRADVELTRSYDVYGK